MEHKQHGSALSQEQSARDGHTHGQFTRISRTAHRCGLCGQIQYKLKWHKAKGRR